MMIYYALFFLLEASAPFYCVFFWVMREESRKKKKRKGGKVPQGHRSFSNSRARHFLRVVVMRTRDCSCSVCCAFWVELATADQNGYLTSDFRHASVSTTKNHYRLSCVRVTAIYVRKSQDVFLGRSKSICYFCWRISCRESISRETCLIPVCARTHTG